MDVVTLNEARCGMEFTTLVGRKFIPDFYEQLILQVRKRPSLWDKKHSGYMNHGLSRVLWTEIGSFFDMPGTDLRKKWKNLRDSYRKELIKINEIAQSNPYIKSKWKHFYTLDFLRWQFLTPETSYLIGTSEEPFEDCEVVAADCLELIETANRGLSATNMNNNSDSCENNDMDFFEVTKVEPQFPENMNYENSPEPQEDEDQHSDDHADPKRRRRGIVNPYNYMQLTYKERSSNADENRFDSMTKKIEELETRLMNVPQCDNDDYHFLLSLLPTLRDFPRDQKMKVRTKIQQLICEEYESLQKGD